MNLERVMQTALYNELEKISVDLTEAARAEISKKNFALTPRQSSTGKPAYPIQDIGHARSALRLVGMHGTDYQKAEVKKDVYRKYPELGHAKVAAGFGDYLKRNSHAFDVAGLGAMGVGALDSVQASARASAAGDKSPEAVTRRRFLGEGAHAGLEAGGLGLLAAPTIAKMRHR